MHLIVLFDLSNPGHLMTPEGTCLEIHTLSPVAKSLRIVLHSHACLLCRDPLPGQCGRECRPWPASFSPPPSCSHWLFSPKRSLWKGPLTPSQKPRVTVQMLSDVLSPASRLTALSLTFFSCKMGIIRPPLQGLVSPQVTSENSFKKIFEDRDCVCSLFWHLA